MKGKIFNCPPVVYVDSSMTVPTYKGKDDVLEQKIFDQEMQLLLQFLQDKNTPMQFAHSLKDQIDRYLNRECVIKPDPYLIYSLPEECKDGEIRLSLEKDIADCINEADMKDTDRN